MSWVLQGPRVPVADPARLIPSSPFHEHLPQLSGAVAEASGLQILKYLVSGLDRNALDQADIKRRCEGIRALHAFTL